MIDSCQSISVPLTNSALFGSRKIRMPRDSNTLSPGPAAGSSPSWYDIPEHPPPTTFTRSPPSAGAPCWVIRSRTLPAALSVSVIDMGDGLRIEV
jgi:hypothetical protein